jgi:hypothetical protein
MVIEEWVYMSHGGVSVLRVGKTAIEEWVSVTGCVARCLPYWVRRSGGSAVD